MERLEFEFNDGGREAAGYKGDAGDCITRAIAITTGRSYQEVYDDLFEGIKRFASTSRCKAARRAARGGGQMGTTPRNGVSVRVYKPYLESIGWKWNPTMHIESGCKVHLRADELPVGKLIVRVSKHVTTVIDGVINDTYDCSREGTRCVYGYYTYAGK